MSTSTTLDDAWGSSCAPETCVSIRADHDVCMSTYNDLLSMTPPELRMPVIQAGIHASIYHAGQKRIDGSPYVEHPFAVAMNLLRWGVADQDIIVAAILHDSVEDCADVIVQRAGLAHLLDGMDEKAQKAEERRLALDEIARTFGLVVRAFVRNVTNPLGDFDYSAHVKSIVHWSPLLVKTADLVHNAGTLSALPIERQARLARRYSDAVDHVTHKMESSLGYRTRHDIAELALVDLARVQADLANIRRQ